MSTTLSSTFTSAIATAETFSGGVPGSNVVVFNTQPESVTLNAGTTPAATLRADFVATLVSGSLTISLEALPGVNSQETVNGVGLRVQFLKISNPVGNANLIVVSQGGSNPYRLDATTATWSIPLPPGASATLNLDNAGDVIGTSHLSILLTGTGAQTANVSVVMG